MAQALAGEPRALAGGVGLWCEHRCPHLSVRGKVASLGPCQESSIFLGSRQGPPWMSWLKGFQTWAPQQIACSSPPGLEAGVPGSQAPPAPLAPAGGASLSVFGIGSAVGFLTRNDKAPRGISVRLSTPHRPPGGTGPSSCLTGPGLVGQGSGWAPAAPQIYRHSGVGLMRSLAKKPSVPIAVEFGAFRSRGWRSQGELFHKK